LYAKALETFRPKQDRADTLKAAGYEEDELTILRDFGEDLFSGLYRLHAIRFGAHLVHLAEGGDAAGPKATIIRDAPRPCSRSPHGIIAVWPRRSAARCGRARSNFGRLIFSRRRTTVWPSIFFTLPPAKTPSARVV